MKVDKGNSRLLWQVFVDEVSRLGKHLQRIFA